MVLKASFLATSLTTRLHGNVKRLPKHALKLDEVKNLVTFLSNYAEQSSLAGFLDTNGTTSSYFCLTQQRYSSEQTLV